MGRGEEPSAREIAQMLNQQAEALARALLPAGFVSGGMFHVGSVHGDKGDSLKIKLRGSDRGSWADYACSRGDPEGTGDMLKLVMLTVGEGDMGRAVKWAKGWLGIESMDPRVLERQRKRAEAAQQRAEMERAENDEKRRLKARNMWLHAAPLLGTPAMEYLRFRGIDFAVIGRLPGAMRFRHDVWHADLRRPVPALLTAGVGLDGAHRATHCIYLHRRPDGVWDKLPPIVRDGKRLKIAKKIFGPGTGHHFPIHKGRSGKRLRDMPAGERLHSGEGLEDALTFAMMHPERRVVAAGTLGNIGAMELPAQCGDYVILAQRDPEGSKADASLEKQIAAQQARAVADGSGRTVRCLWPGEGFKDLNDELRGVRM